VKPSSGVKKIAVIGGGISGLASAHYLKKLASERGLAVKIDLFEAEARAGGKFDAVKDSGFTVEAGPNGFLDSKPWTLNLVRDLGMQDELLPSDQSAARRFIYSRGKLHELKASPVSFFLGGPLSIRGRLRILAEPLATPTPRGQDTSLAEFARRRLGSEALERLLDPMVSGIFAGDPSRMSLRASFPRIAELEEQYGGLTKAMFSISAERKRAKKRGEEQGISSGPSGPGGVLTSFKNGVSQLTDRLAADMGEGFHAGSPVSGLSIADDEFRIDVKGDIFPADGIILATPADSASDILNGVAVDSSRILSQIPYSPMAVVGVGYDIKDLKQPPVGFGYLIPGVENRKILGALWTSSIFPGRRSPEGSYLIRVMIGGAKDHETPFLADEDLLETVRREIAATMRLTAEPSFTSVVRWEKAIPLYTVGHLERVAKAESGLPRGLVLAGNAYRGVGINDCVREAEVAAGKVLETIQ
jgi:oxygen-dependent protoporphyrinogen oxidase